MKTNKILPAILCGAILFSLAGCGQAAPATSTQAEAPQEGTTAEATTEATTETPAETEATVPDNSDDIFVSAYPAFAVTSQSLHDGKWDKITAHDGENASPELSWEPVEGATEYAIYMIDMDTGYNIHWKSKNIKETTLPEGWAPVITEYNGPYPPSGSTHNYTVYVIALKAPVRGMQGGIHGIYANVKDFIDALDTDAEGNTGNIVAVGRVSGTYTR